MRNRPFQLGAVLQFLWNFHAAAAVFYVNVNSANPTPPYAAWGTAATRIQDAVDLSTNGDQILVTNGTYSAGGRAVYGAATNRVAVDRPVVVESVNGPQVTIIQGVASPAGATVRGVYLADGAALIGFTVKSGGSRNTGDWFNEQSGGGVWCQSTNAVVSNCILTLNYAYGGGGGVVSGTLNNCTLSGNNALEGGGAYDANLNNCVLSGNSATWGGGADYGALSNCNVSGNSARDPAGQREGEGGGAYSCSAINCLVTGNYARVDGGGAAYGGLVNCLVANNSSLQGGGASGADLVNCTIVGNSAPTDGGVGGGVGGGVLGGSAENSIIVSNSASFGGGDYDDSTFSYCCSSSDPGGDGNITSDPLFVDYAGGDYRLQFTSPCIDAGSNGFVTTSTDLDGHPRIVNGVVDMGAYEYQHAPWFLVSPASQIVLAGSNLSLTVSVLGDPPAYQWWFNATPLADGGRVAGAYSNSLTIALTVTNDTGSYWVTVSNSSGMATSAVAAVTVELPVTITGQPANRTVLAGSNASFTVAATGFAPPSYLWYSNAVALTNGGRISGATSATLSISNVQTNDSAAYQVILTNNYGSATSSVANLTVLAPVQILSQSGSQAVLLGGAATFAVAAIGTGPLNYQWYFNGAPLADGGRITGSATPTLNIANVQMSDAGGYVTVVANLLSSATSLTASLTPQASLSPSVRYVTLNSSNPLPPYLNWSTAATDIQSAIDAAVAGDLVFVSNGIYKTGGRVVYGSATNRVVINKAVAVQSVNGPGATTITGFNTNPVVYRPGRCVYLTNGASLSGFTLTHGGASTSGDLIREQSGGAVWCESSGATVSNCIISSNLATRAYGGGAFGGTLINCVLTSNSASYGGGAASNTLLNCTLAGNFVSYQNLSYGGGADGCLLSNCLIVGNHFGSDSGYGGGAAFSVLTSCVVSNNSANTGGGGVSFGVVSDSLISSNQASQWGGGAYSNVLINCVLNNNFASGNGGGAYNSALVNCTVISNTAASARTSVAGGGAYGGSVSNGILYYNSAATGSNFYFPGNAAINYSCTTPLPTNGLGNITNEPALVNLGGGDFHLQSNSPCINAGNNSCVTNGTDLDGNPRIVGGTVDIGAYEFQSPTSIISYAWLQLYGLPTDGSADYADTDGNGMNNWQKWIAGLDPLDPSSVLQMLSASNTSNPSGIIVTWQSVSGINYFIQRSTDLSALPAFSTLQTNIAGQAGTTSYTDTTATNSGPFFYRIGVPSLAIGALPPSLSIACSAGNVVVSWPSPSTGFVLQTNGVITTVNWSNYAGIVTTNGTTNSVTISPASGNEFFRLLQQ